MPLVARVDRWTHAMPPHTMGQLDRGEAGGAGSKEIAGFAVAGGSFRGVGIPNCIESGEAAVSKSLGEWGIELAEDAVDEKRSY
mgnify:CR=1 FL=1